VFIVLPKVLHVEVAVSTDLKLDKLNVQPDQFRLNVQPNQYRLRPGRQLVTDPGNLVLMQAKGGSCRPWLMRAGGGISQAELRRLHTMLKPLAIRPPRCNFQRLHPACRDAGCAVDPADQTGSCPALPLLALRRQGQIQPTSNEYRR
jgi:hypothetical protein